MRSKDEEILRKLYGFNTNFLESWFDNNELVAFVMSRRCMVSGCQYGIEGLDHELKDKCIWCGRERPFQQFKGISVPDLVEEYNLMNKKDEKLVDTKRSN